MLSNAARITEAPLRSLDVRSDVIAKRLSAFVGLTEEEISFLRLAGSRPPSHWRPNTLIEDPASDPAALLYVISGWAARVREVKGGRRQIVQLILPSDVLSPHIHVCHRSQSVLSLTRVQTVSGGPIRIAARDRGRFPGISAATDMAAAHDRALLMDQVVRLGQQTALERLANLFLELHYRCSTVGLVNNASFAFPLTQQHLGDLVGLSVVHVNRMLQILRQKGLICLKQGRLTLLNLPGLSDIAAFEPPKLEYCS